MPKLNGAQKAAIILLTLGEEPTSLILKNLSTSDIKQLGLQMSAIQEVKKEISDDLLKDFTQRFHEEGDIYIPGEQFFRGLLPNVVGTEEALEMMTVIEKEREKIPFKNVREMDARILASFIRSEHPQTIAIILVHLGQEKASEVLEFLPETLQFEVVNRIAYLDSVPPDLIREVDAVLERELLSIGKGTQQLLGGIPAVAEIINNCDKRTGEAILQTMEETDAELAEKVRKLMFVFEDLIAVSDVGIRELLKEIRNEDLTLALKTASDELKTKIFKNLSQRAAQMLEEDLSVMGPARLSDVEVAQQNILNVARRLEKEGKIVLASGDSGDALV